MPKLSYKLTNLLVLLCLPSIALASATSLGDVANNLMVPTTMVTKLLRLACYVAGFALVFTALAQYRIHRQSPKLVPLATPIILLLLGIISLLIPYGSTLLPSFSALEQAPEQPRAHELPLPPAQKHRGPLMPGTTTSDGRAEPHHPHNNAPPAKQGGGHWSNDPRYN